MSEPSTSSNKSILKCTKCHVKLPRGQSSSLCANCSVPQSLTETSTPVKTSVGQTVVSLQVQPEWMNPVVSVLSELSAASKISTDALNRMATQMASAFPPAEMSQRKRSAKRSRVEQRSPSPASSASVSPSWGFPDRISSQGDELSEGECSDQDEDMNQESVKLSETIDNLVTAVRDTLQIQDVPATSSQQGFTFFPSSQARKEFPVCDDIKTILNKAWSRPDRRFIRSKRFNMFYPFPVEDILLWANAPKIDPSVARLAKNTALPVSNDASFRDPADRRVESVARNIFEASGSGLRPVFASAYVARTIAEWVQRLQHDVSSGVDLEDIQRTILNISQAVSYICESTIEAGSIFAQISALSVTIRRAMWLKVWSGDVTSKRSLINLPFVGHRLFGARLDELISDATGGKSTHLPQVRPKGVPVQRANTSRFQPFRRFSYAGGNPRNPSGAGSRTQSEGQRRKPSFKPRPSWHPRTQSSRSAKPKKSSA